VYWSETGVNAYNLQAIHSQQVKDLISAAKIQIIYESTKERAKKKEPPHHQRFQLFLMIHNGQSPYCEWLTDLCCKDTAFC